MKRSFKEIVLISVAFVFILTGITLAEDAAKVAMKEIPHKGIKIGDIDFEISLVGGDTDVRGVKKGWRIKDIKTEGPDKTGRINILSYDEERDELINETTFVFLKDYLVSATVDEAGIEKLQLELEKLRDDLGKAQKEIDKAQDDLGKANKDKEDAEKALEEAKRIKQKAEEDLKNAQGDREKAQEALDKAKDDLGKAKGRLIKLEKVRKEYIEELETIKKKREEKIKERDELIQKRNESIEIKENITIKKNTLMEIIDRLKIEIENARIGREVTMYREETRTREVTGTRTETRVREITRMRTETRTREVTRTVETGETLTREVPTGETRTEQYETGKYNIVKRQIGTERVKYATGKRIPNIIELSKKTVEMPEGQRPPGWENSGGTYDLGTGLGSSCTKIRSYTKEIITGETRTRITIPRASLQQWPRETNDVMRYISSGVITKEGQTVEQALQERFPKAGIKIFMTSGNDLMMNIGTYSHRIVLGRKEAVVIKKTIDVYEIKETKTEYKDEYAYRDEPQYIEVRVKETATREVPVTRTEEYPETREETSTESYTTQVPYSHREEYTVEVPYLRTETYTERVPYTTTEVSEETITKLERELETRTTELTEIIKELERIETTEDITIRIQTLEREINEYEERIREATTRIEETTVEVTNAQNDVNTAQRHVDQAEESIKIADGRISEIQVRLNDADKRINDARKRLDIANKKIGDLEKQIAATRKRIETLNMQIKDVENRINMVKLVPANLSDDLNKAKEDLSKAMVDLEKAEEDLAKAKSDLQKAQYDLKVAEADRDKAQLDLEKAKADRSRAVHDLERAQDEKKYALAELGKEKVKHQTLISRREELVKERTRIIEQNKSVMEKRSTLEQTITRMEQNLENLKKGRAITIDREETRTRTIQSTRTETRTREVTRYRDEERTRTVEKRVLMPKMNFRINVRMTGPAFVDGHKVGGRLMQIANGNAEPKSEIERQFWEALVKHAKSPAPGGELWIGIIMSSDTQGEIRKFGLVGVDDIAIAKGTKELVSYARARNWPTSIGGGGTSVYRNPEYRMETVTERYTERVPYAHKESYTTTVPYSHTESYTVKVPYSYVEKDEEAISRLVKEIETKKKELVELNRQIVGKERLEEIAKQINQLDIEIRKSVERIKELQGKVDDADKRIDDANKRLDDANKRIDDAQKRLDDANKRIDDANKRIDDANNRIKDAQKRIDDANDRIKRASETIAELNKRLEEVNVAGGDPESEFVKGTVVGTKDGSVIANIKTTAVDGNGDCAISEYEEFREEEMSGTYSVSHDTRAKLCKYDDFKKIVNGTNKHRIKWGVKDGKAVEEEVEEWKTFTDEDGNDVTIHTLRRRGDKVPEHILNPEGYSVFEKIVKDKDGKVITSVEYRLEGNKYYINEKYLNTPDVWRGDQNSIINPPLQGIDKYHNYVITMNDNGSIDVDQMGKYEKDGEVLWHSEGSTGGVGGYNRDVSMGAGRDYQGDPSEVGRQNDVDLSEMPGTMNPPKPDDRTVNITREQVQAARGETAGTTETKPAVSAREAALEKLKEGATKPAVETKPVTLKLETPSTVTAPQQPAEEKKEPSAFEKALEALKSGVQKITGTEEKKVLDEKVTKDAGAPVSVPVTASGKAPATTGEKLQAELEKKSAAGEKMQGEIQQSQTQQKTSTSAIDKAISGAKGFEQLKTEEAKKLEGAETDKKKAGEEVTAGGQPKK